MNSQDLSIPERIALTLLPKLVTELRQAGAPYLADTEKALVGKYLAAACAAGIDLAVAEGYNLGRSASYQIAVECGDEATIAALAPPEQEAEPAPEVLVARR